MTDDRVDALRRELRAFVDAREWDQFHAPKNLAVSLAIEAGELLEVFQWVNPTASELRDDAARLARVREEVADAFLYALLLADKLGFDLVEAARAKLDVNAARYPVARARGRSTKYSEL